jgi:hypothetical protein
VADGALRAGQDAGLPLHRFPLAKTGDAHAAVQNNAVGKVIIEVTAPLSGARQSAAWSARPSVGVEEYCTVRISALC